VCENIERPLLRSACYLEAWNNKNKCEKNPPGYPGEPGTPSGIPNENEKYQAIFNAAVPACLVAISM
jgi:hypothetical protein